MTDTVQYPELSRLLEERFNEWLKINKPSGRKLTLRGRAKLISEKTGSQKLSYTSLGDWIKGRSKPTAASVNILSQFFYPEDLSKQDSFRAEIERATSVADTLFDPFDEVGEGKRPLRVGVVPFDCFCGDPSSSQGTYGFLDRLFRYYFSYAGLTKKQSAEFINISISEAERALCSEGGVDMVLGLFAEPERARNLWFYREIPILIPLNAVFPKDTSFPKNLPFLISTPGHDAELRKRILPIIDPTELGGVFVQNYLGLRNQSDFKAIPYNINSYAEALIEATRSPDPRIPILLTDEVSCLYVQKKISALSYEARSKSTHKIISDLVMGPRVAGNSPDHVLPRYRYSVAIARRHLRWIEFFRDSFELFLESNTELVADLYTQLKTELFISFGSRGSDPEKNVQKRISHWLSCDIDDSNNYPPSVSPSWLSVLKHANTMRKQL